MSDGECAGHSYVIRRAWKVGAELNKRSVSVAGEVESSAVTEAVPFFDDGFRGVVLVELVGCVNQTCAPFGLNRVDGFDDSDELTGAAMQMDSVIVVGFRGIVKDTPD